MSFSIGGSLTPRLGDHESMRELTTDELTSELNNLDGSNGWGISEYRKDLVITKEKLIATVMNLVDIHGSYPVGMSLDSDFSYIVVRNINGTFTFAYSTEVSMLNYKKILQPATSLRKSVENLVTSLFRDHLNKIKVIGH
jgi:hypothetical protein